MRDGTLYSECVEIMVLSTRAFAISVGCGSFITGSECLTRLIVIRHGHIAANTGELHAPMAGWTDFPLSSRGRLDIERLKEYLARGPPFDAIYLSPLSRASDTAQLLVAAGLGPLRLLLALKEINCGQLDGLPVREVQRRFPDL